MIDITGMKYGKLIAIHEADRAGHHRRYLCKCECGNETIAYMDSLRSGHKIDCGCSQYRKCKGESTSRLYRIWSGMRRRCREEKYSNYHGRGIKVCEEWNNSYLVFRNWALQNGYDEHAKKGECTIDRINNNGNYEPSNCRWVDMMVQSNNTRTAHKITINGETHSISEWARIVGARAGTLSARINSGWSDEDAITIPIREKKHKDYGEPMRAEKDEC